MDDSKAASPKASPAWKADAQASRKPCRQLSHLASLLPPTIATTAPAWVPELLNLRIFPPPSRRECFNSEEIGVQQLGKRTFCVFTHAMEVPHSLECLEVSAGGPGCLHTLG